MTTLVSGIRPNLGQIKLYHSMEQWIQLHNDLMRYLYRYNANTDYALVALYDLSTDLMFSYDPYSLHNRFGTFNYDGGLRITVDSDNSYGIELCDDDAIELFSQTGSGESGNMWDDSLTAIAPVKYDYMTTQTLITVKEAI